MSEIKDGGPAFPTPENKFGDYSASMSLRDYFAAAALNGYMSGGMRPEGSGDIVTPDSIAVRAFRYADAMLRAREVSQP